MKNERYYKLEEKTFSVLAPYIVFTELYEKDSETGMRLILKSELVQILIDHPEILQNLKDASLSTDFYIMGDVLIKRPKAREYSFDYKNNPEFQMAIQMLEDRIYSQGEIALSKLYLLLNLDAQSKSDERKLDKDFQKLNKQWNELFFMDRPQHKVISYDTNESKGKLKFKKKDNNELGSKEIEVKTINFSRDLEEGAFTEFADELAEYMLTERLVPIISDYFQETITYNFVKRLLNSDILDAKMEQKLNDHKFEENEK